MYVQKNSTIKRFQLVVAKFHKSSEKKKIEKHQQIFEMPKIVKREKQNGTEGVLWQTR